MNCPRFARIVVVSVFMALAACAQSPQRIALTPVFPTPASQPGQGAPVHIRISDQRDSKVLGSRGGVYRQTATFSLAEELSQAVQPALQKHMAAMGFDVNSLSPQTTDLHVIFTSLVYNHPEQGGVGHDMDMIAGVTVEASKQDGSRYEGRYKVKRNEKFFNAPSATQNGEKVNGLVVEVLENMLADPKLMGFIQQR